LISREPIFFLRYSGVRPIINPATNTATTASINIPYRPEPTPPGATSPSAIFRMRLAPPRLVYESWNESTDPVDVPVVAVANKAEFGTPKRVSVPSVAAPTASGTVPWWASWNPVLTARLPSRISAMTDTIARPWRVSPTILPKARGRLNGIRRSKKISNQFVHVVGFSNGCDELTL
jgi:hypothetical protein